MPETLQTTDVVRLSFKDYAKLLLDVQHAS